MLTSTHFLVCMLICSIAHNRSVYFLTRVVLASVTRGSSVYRESAWSVSFQRRWMTSKWSRSRRKRRRKNRWFETGNQSSDIRFASQFSRWFYHTLVLNKWSDFITLQLRLCLLLCQSVFICLCLSASLSTAAFLSVYLALLMSVCLVYLPVSVSVCLPLHMYVSLYLSVCFCICLSLSLFVCLLLYLCLYVCLPLSGSTVETKLTLLTFFIFKACYFTHLQFRYAL